MKIFAAGVAGRRFLVIEGVASIPVDRITKIDLRAPNGGADNSVRIHTDDPGENYTFAYENVDAVRAYLEEHRLTSSPISPGDVVKASNIAADPDHLSNDGTCPMCGGNFSECRHTWQELRRHNKEWLVAFQLRR